MHRKVFYIAIDNLDPNFLGYLGKEMHTKFIDILAKDSFSLNKHFCSSPKNNFFNVLTGMFKPDIAEHPSLTDLMSRDFGGVCITNQKNFKATKEKYVDESLIDFIIHPMDMTSKAIKYIKNEELGFVYFHHTIIDAKPVDTTYAEQIYKADIAVGKLLAGIEEFGDYEESYIVLAGTDIDSPCLFKAPSERNKFLYNASRNVNFVSRDVDILPTIFDMEEEYHRMPVNIDGVSLTNNLVGKDQKLTAFCNVDEKINVYNHKGKQLV